MYITFLFQIYPIPEGQTANSYRKVRTKVTSARPDNKEKQHVAGRPDNNKSYHPKGYTLDTNTAGTGRQVKIVLGQKPSKLLHVVS